MPGDEHPDRDVCVHRRPCLRQIDASGKIWPYMLARERQIAAPQAAQQIYALVHPERTLSYVKRLASSCPNQW